LLIIRDMVEQIISKRVYFSGNGQARFLNEMINS